MEYKGTVDRLIDLIQARNCCVNDIVASRAIDRLIAKQIDRVKVNVMTYILDSMDYFNSKPEYETCERCGIKAADVCERPDGYANDVHNDPDAVHTVCDECDYQNLMDI